MHFSLALSLLPLAVSVGALRVNEPAKGDDVDVTGSFTVKWSSVNTDPNTVDIVLVNNAVYPNIEQKIASDIDTSQGSFTASGLKGVTDGRGFQINLMSTSTQNTGILAQSEQFDVVEPAKSSSETSTTGTTSTVSSSSSSSSTVISITSSTSTGASTTETEVSTTGILTPVISTTEIPMGLSASGPLPIEATAKDRSSTDICITQATETSSAIETSSATETATSNANTLTYSGMTTSASSATQSAGSSTAVSASASPIYSTGAAANLAVPGAAGLLFGVLAMNL